MDEEDSPSSACAVDAGSDGERVEESGDASSSEESDDGFDACEAFAEQTTSAAASWCLHDKTKLSAEEGDPLLSFFAQLIGHHSVGMEWRRPAFAGRLSGRDSCMLACWLALSSGRLSERGLRSCRAKTQGRSGHDAERLSA